MGLLKILFSHTIIKIGKILYGLKWEGIENIPKKGACIFVLNHTSPLDVFIFSTLKIFRNDLFYFMLDAGFEHPFLAWFFKKFDALPVSKTGRLFQPSLEKALILLNQDKALAIAVEGQMSWDGTLQPLKSSAAWLALNTRVPIIPVIQQGAYDTWPCWERFPKLRGKILIRIGKAFWLEEEKEVSKEAVKRANKIIRQKMLELYF